MQFFRFSLSIGREIAVLCLIPLCLCHAAVGNAGEANSSTSTGKYTYVYGDRLLTEKGVFEIIRDAGEDYRAALDRMQSEKKSSQHIFMGSGVAGGLALIAGAILIGVGDGRSAALIGSGIGLTASGAVTLGLGTYFSMQRRRLANRHLVEIIDHFNKEHETRILPSYGLNKIDMENSQIKEKIIRLSLQF